jgi:hypothetical protein
MCRIYFKPISRIKIQKLAVQLYQFMLKLVSYTAPYFYFTCLTPDGFTIAVRGRGGGGVGQQPPKFLKAWKFRQTLGKIKRILADLSENRLNSGNFITILHKNSGKLSTAPLESISPVRLWILLVNGEALQLNELRKLNILHM